MVNLTVTTPLGTSPTAPADHFAYTACTVPKLKGRKLKAAKKKLKHSDCKFGKVKRIHSGAKKKGKVVAQTPRAGRVLPAGSKVSVKLG
jgi:beta-lactam-binding protein with PASTA domain